MDNNILGVEFIYESLIRLRLHRAGGPSGMRAKHLRMWLLAATREEDLNLWKWEKVVSITQAAFRKVSLATSFIWKMVVMIPKGVGIDFKGIGLVGFLWKAISGIINRRISPSIQFHDALHNFRTRRGTETATLKGKLLQQLISMMGAVLHSILLNLLKVYDALYRGRCLDILEGYRVGPRTLRILPTYWVQFQMEENAGGHYSPVL